MIRKNSFSSTENIKKVFFGESTTTSSRSKTRRDTMTKFILSRLSTDTSIKQYALQQPVHETYKHTVNKLWGSHSVPIILTVPTVSVTHLSTSSQFSKYNSTVKSTDKALHTQMLCMTTTLMVTSLTHV